MLSRGSIIFTVWATVLTVGACGPTANPGDQSEQPDAGGPEIRLPPRESDYDCQDIPETGECRGDVAMYCDVRSSRIVEKRCGARGLACADDSEQGARCVDETGEEQEVPAEGDGGGGGTSEACGSVTYQGECDGNTVRFCSADDETGELYEFECGGDRACDLIEISTGDSVYGCRAKTCEELGVRGACASNSVVKYCLDNEIQTVTCESGESCQLTGIGEGYYDCEPTVIEV